MLEDKILNKAQKILGLDAEEAGVKQGTGQNTTFNSLGFPGVNDKPDGWYLPKSRYSVALILETKSDREDVRSPKWIEELKKNMSITSSKYARVVGILYNGSDVLVFKLQKRVFEEVKSAPALQDKRYYLSLFKDDNIDKQQIYTLTKRINEALHAMIKMKNLYHRMIVTACALVAKRYGASLHPDQSFTSTMVEIRSVLNDYPGDQDSQKSKLSELLKIYDLIHPDNPTDKRGNEIFVESVTEISECINSNQWNGEDVMGIFFNEFNRYKDKSEQGQVFTPDHITSLMYRLIRVGKDDRVLDATCGSGAFLMKAMCNMIREAGGNDTAEAKRIKSEQLYGIEIDSEIFALACANMLIHKDGRTNLERKDTTSADASEWIKSKNISKVLMNPPYETKNQCMKIVENVLDSVPVGTQCAFILPDKKLEKDYRDSKYGNKVLRKHTLTTIVKLPENLFFKVGVKTSIFIFETGTPQGDRDIIGYYIENDGFQTVKNQGRHDVKGLWQEHEDYWVKAIHNGLDDKYGTRQIIHPSDRLSYQLPRKPFEIYEEDLIKAVMDYEMFKRGVDVKELGNALLQKVLYSGNFPFNEEIQALATENDMDYEAD